tara:strand:+ start:32375 stop:33247 length:873 start_codon:yes stop_codon:yes gene_type:complete
MKTVCILLFSLVIGCQVDPVASTSLALCADGAPGCDDAGATDSGTDAGPSCALPAGPLCSGSRWLGDSSGSTIGGLPVMLASWEQYQAGVFRVGQGQAGMTWASLDVLQLDADDKISFLLDGGQVIKLQDHPQVGNLWWFGDVAHVWFGNTLRRDADLTFQGTNSGSAAEGIANSLTIRGQNMHALAGAALAQGGDVEIRAGNAASADGLAVRDPGEVVIGGGRVGYETRGNIALHEEPEDWGGMEGGIFVRDVRTAPTADPSAGGYLFASGGALYWHGSAGTITQIAAP